MRQLAAMHVRSVLLTSGTLSPLDTFAHELQLPFKISLENPHVIDPSQVHACPPLHRRCANHVRGACTLHVVLSYLIAYNFSTLLATLTIAVADSCECRQLPEASCHATTPCQSLNSPSLSADKDGMLQNI